MISNFALYLFFSFLFPVLIALYSIHQHKYFYSSVIYLIHSKPALFSFYNVAISSILLFAKLVQRIFFGNLRFRETERVQVKMKQSLIESCVAMTIFREDLKSYVLGWFVVDLFFKIFHCLLQERVEMVEEQDQAPLISHVRITAFMSMLWACDMTLIYLFVDFTWKKGPSVIILFAFDFIVLHINLISIFAKYMCTIIDILKQRQWDAKTDILFYNELVTDLMQLSSYIIFFFYIQLYYPLPLYLVRDIYITYKKFTRKLADFNRYRKIMHTMNSLFPDVTEEELAAGDPICIVCRETMTTNAKKLNCGHVFHVQCLRGWLKRQMSCPTCRATVSVENYEGNEVPAISLQSLFVHSRNFFSRLRNFVNAAFHTMNRNLNNNARQRRGRPNNNTPQNSSAHPQASLRYPPPNPPQQETQQRGLEQMRPHLFMPPMGPIAQQPQMFVSGSNDAVMSQASNLADIPGQSAATFHANLYQQFPGAVITYPTEHVTHIHGCPVLSREQLMTFNNIISRMQSKQLEARPKQD